MCDIQTTATRSEPPPPNPRIPFNHITRQTIGSRQRYSRTEVWRHSQIITIQRCPTMHFAHYVFLRRVEKACRRSRQRELPQRSSIASVHRIV